jgi:class 3 adenylate cyclase
MAKVGVDDKVNTEEKQKGGNKISTFLKLPENIANDVEFSLCGKSTASVAPSALEEGKKSKVHLAGFNLKFSFLGEPFPDAQKAFHTEYAKQSLFWFRYSTFAMGTFMGIYAFYDNYYYGTEGKTYMLATLARFAGIVPSLLLAGLFTTTKYYYNDKIRDFVLMFLAFGLGFAIMSYNVATKGGHYGTFALYFATIFTLAPLPFFESSVLGIVLWGMYLPVLWYSGGKIITTEIMYQMATLLVSLALYMYFRFEYLRFLAEDVIRTSIYHRDRDKLKEEQGKSRDILLSMVPASLVSHIETKSSKKYARSHENVTVLFAELCNFSKIAQELDEPKKVVTVLNIAFTKFDALVDSHNIYKVETVGQVYMAVAGAPSEVENHAEIAAAMAISMMKQIPAIRDEVKSRFGEDLSKLVDIHIGLNSGKIVAGVCGKKSKRYKLFGDTVNTASRMESTCPYGAIQCSETTTALLKDSKDHTFQLKERGAVKMKGKGEMYPSLLEVSNEPVVVTPKFINGKQDETSIDRKRHSRNSILQRVETQANEMDLIQEEIGDHEHAHESDLKWLAFWGKPFHPFADTKKKNHVGLGAFYYRFEQDYVKKEVNNYLKGIVAMAIVTFVAVAAFLYMDIGRHSTYKSSFCTSWHLDKTSCIDSRSKLCKWDDGGCVRDHNVSITNDCEWHFDAATEEKFKDRVETQWTYALIARFGVIAPLCIGLIILTRLPWFTDPKNVRKPAQQFVLFVILLNLGCALIALTWIGGSPGTGPIICWMFMAMNISYFTYLPRIMSMFLLAILYSCAIYFNNPFKSVDALCQEPYRYIATRFQYIFFSILCLGMPLMTRETYKRKSLLRKKTIISSQRNLRVLKVKTTELLEGFLPRQIVQRLEARKPGQEIADRFKSVSVLFTDMKGFTKYSSKVEPLQLVQFLNIMYEKFDEITDKTVMYKVEIIGDAYYCVAGCPDENKDHAARASFSALKMLDAVEDMKKADSQLAEADVKIRIGVHTDSVVAGVVGVKDPRYHLFGETVLLANYMESEGVPSKVQISKETHDSLVEAENYEDGSPFSGVEFLLTSRGPVDIPTFGKRETYFVDGTKDDQSMSGY